MFLVPGEPEERAAELAYARFAERAGAAVVPRSERICSITFSRRATIWSASVGEQLTGSTEHRTFTRGGFSSTWEDATDGATALAVVAGPACYFVFTDTAPDGRAKSELGTPLLVYQPDQVTTFDG